MSKIEVLNSRRTMSVHEKGPSALLEFTATGQLTSIYMNAKTEAEQKVLDKSLKNLFEPNVRRLVKRGIARALLPWVAAVITTLPFYLTPSRLLDRLLAFSESELI